MNKKGRPFQTMFSLVVLLVILFTLVVFNYIVFSLLGISEFVGDEKKFESSYSKVDSRVLLEVFLEDKIMVDDENKKIREILVDILEFYNSGEDYGELSALVRDKFDKEYSCEGKNIFIYGTYGYSIQEEGAEQESYVSFIKISNNLGHEEEFYTLDIDGGAFVGAGGKLKC